MTGRQNCWEVKKCGREQGGANADKNGVCPVSTETSSDGINKGKNGGRICWAIAGTFCNEKVQGTFAEKESTCMSCDFYKRVKEEEGTVDFVLLKPGQVYSPKR